MWWWGPCAGASCCSDVIVPQRKRAAALYDELVPLLTDRRASLDLSSTCDAPPDELQLNSRSANGTTASTEIAPGIYRARDVRTHDAVALKVFAKGVLKNQITRRRIRQEIKVLSLCRDHPNILRLYGVYSSKHTFEIAFELASGGEIMQRIADAAAAAAAGSSSTSLSSSALSSSSSLTLPASQQQQQDQQDQQPLPLPSELPCYRITERAISRVVASAASALKFMHEKRIVHGEVRPEHLLYMDLEPDARVVLVDFGRAAAWRELTFRSRVHRRSRHKFLWHDPHSIKFLPPFVVDGNGLDHDGHSTSWQHAQQVDVWSLGVVMYVLLCGAFPFDGVTLEEIRERILHQPLLFPTHSHYVSPQSEQLQLDPNQNQNQERQSVYGENGSGSIYLSRAAKDLLTRLLEKDPALAPSMDDVCAHPWLSEHVAADVRWSSARLEEFGAFAESYARDVATSSRRRYTAASLGARERQSSVSYGNVTMTMRRMPYDVHGIDGNGGGRGEQDDQEDQDQDQELNQSSRMLLDGDHDQDAEDGEDEEEEMERPSFVSTDGNLAKRDAFFEERLSADAYMRLASAELEALSASHAAAAATTPSPRRRNGESNTKPQPRKSRALAEVGTSKTPPSPVGDFWPVLSKQRRLLSFQSLSFRSTSSESKDD